MTDDDMLHSPRPIGSEIICPDNRVWVVTGHEQVDQYGRRQTFDHIAHVGHFNVENGYKEYLDGRREYVPDWQI